MRDNPQPNSDYPKIMQAVAATICYYQALDIAPSSFEVWRYLIRPKSLRNRLSGVNFKLSDVRRALNALLAEGLLEEHRGHFCLNGRKRTILARFKGEVAREKKWRLFQSRARLLRWVPFVKAVWASGSMSFDNANPKSDFDVLLVARPGRIWTVWVLANVWLILFGVKRRKARISNRLCLNHLITEDALRIPFYSIYTAQQYAHLTPMIDEDHLLAWFFQKNNWLMRFLFLDKIKTLQDFNNFRTIGNSAAAETVRSFLEKILDGAWGARLEEVFKRHALNRIQRHPLTGKSGGRISVGSRSLEFHPDSKEKSVLARYNKIIREVGGFFPHGYREIDSGLVK